MSKTKTISLLFAGALLAAPLMAQGKRLWVLHAQGEMTEYDPVTFAAKQTVKVPAELVEAPQSLLMNHSGQMLYAAPLALPLSEDDLAGAQKVWFWDGHAAKFLTREVARDTAATGSNLAVSESAPAPRLSAEGTHLFWFANQARRLQRDGVDLSTTTTWAAWETDVAGEERKDLVSIALPECSCPTGSCEESCPYGETWTPESGVDKFFLLTQLVANQTQPLYKSTSVYEESAGKWNATMVEPPLRRVLDAPSADVILEAVPDTGCCGWSNQSDDQTLLRIHGKTVTIFDERENYKNANYDVSFYSENGKLAPGLSAVAFTIIATAKPNKPIQLAERGQANPEESQRIRKVLTDLPEVEVKSVDEKGSTTSQRIALLPHATLVGWISEKEVLIVEEKVLVVYDVAKGTRRKSSVRVEDAAHVFLR
jgi:hypothetical protein